jgi:hypothetical protein
MTSVDFRLKGIVKEKSMQSLPQTAPVSKKMFWAGHILSALAILFLLFDGIIKVTQHPEAVRPTIELGYPASLVLGIGLIELVCLAVYVIPRTSILGAILLTGYLGGAVATQVRAGTNLFSIFFPIIIGALVWGGLFLRDNRLRALIPLRS